MKPSSLILKTATAFLHPALLLVSLVVLYRGHNAPGGGFSGGLIAAAAYIMLALGHGVRFSRKRLFFHPLSLIITGLLIALVSSLFALGAGRPFMTGLWLPGVGLPLLGKIHLGTPLLFDCGVYLTVIGFATLSLLTLMEKE